MVKCPHCGGSKLARKMHDLFSGATHEERCCMCCDGITMAKFAIIAGFNIGDALIPTPEETAST